MVECYFAKVDVAGSSPAIRSMNKELRKTLSDGIYKASFQKNFELTDEEYQKFIDWHYSLPEVDSGVCGGRYSFTFVPTSIGCFVTVKDCVTKKELELVDGSDF